MVLDAFLQSKASLSRTHSNTITNLNSNNQVHTRASRYGHLLKAGKESFSRLVPLSTPLKEVFSDPCWNISGPLLRLGEYGRKGVRDRSADAMREGRMEGDGIGEVREEDEVEEEGWHGFVHLEFTDDEDDGEDHGGEGLEEEEVEEGEEEDGIQFARRTTLDMNFNMASITCYIHSAETHAENDDNL